MTEQAYQERSSSRSGYRGRDASPDSVIFTLESNFSLFSSASASVDRCSFASDAHDRDSLASEISLHLAGSRGGGGQGNELHEASSGPDRDRDRDPDPDPNKLVTIHSSNTKQHAHAHSRLFRKVEKAKVQKEEDNNKALAASIELLEDDSSSHLIDSARNSFSLALKECQERRSRSEAVCKKADRRRPASLDLNNVIAAAASPRLSGMKKNTISSSSRKSAGTFPSPGTPNYRVAMQKGWSSERVPLHHNHSNNKRQQVNANASLLLPFNNNGRTLPSKWEDAERWIFSPVSGDGGMRTSIHQVTQRRPKSKSGPLGPPGIAYYSLYSPAMPIFDWGNMGNFMAASSPFSAAVINSADGLSTRSNGNGVRTEPCMTRSVSVHGCSEVLPHSSFSSQDEKLDDVKDVAATDLCSVSRRDMATQMSPEGSCNHSSSPSMRRPSFSEAAPSILPIVEVQNVHSSKSSQVVRDVQVDERVTVTRWSKKHRSRNQGKKTSDIVDDWRKKSVDATRASSPWDVSEAAKSISKVKRDEAKITAWENLQKAKAEAAIRKLEMKLEKKRSSSMDKIMNKLRSAQKRAQEMRSSVLANQTHQVSRTPHKAISFRRTRQMGSLSGCFTCHAF